MLDSWNQSIFSNIKNRLQDSAMKLVHAERNGEAFDSQLVIGVRESYGGYMDLICYTLNCEVATNNISISYNIIYVVLTIYFYFCSKSE